MTKKRINFLMNRPLSNEKEELLKNYYAQWRMVNKETRAPFTAIDNEFRDKHLATLEGGPLKLYMYFAFASNNDHGHSWHSVQRIAEFFDTQTRTVDNWISVLVKRDLIYRKRTKGASNTTFLIPYTDTIIPLIEPRTYKSVDQKLIDSFVSMIKNQEEIYGEIVDVYQIFQWRMKAKKRTIENPHNCLLIVTRRNNGVLIGHRHVFKSLETHGVSELQGEDLSLFESPFMYKSQPIKGFFVDSEFPLYSKRGISTLKDFMNQIVKGDRMDYEMHPSIDYGLIADFPDLKEMLESDEPEVQKEES